MFVFLLPFFIVIDDVNILVFMLPAVWTRIQRHWSHLIIDTYSKIFKFNCLRKSTYMKRLSCLLLGFSGSAFMGQGIILEGFHACCWGFQMCFYGTSNKFSRQHHEWRIYSWVMAVFTHSSSESLRGTLCYLRVLWNDRAECQRLALFYVYWTAYFITYS